MQVFALIGGSGTGKSHRASYLAYRYNIPLIVDDGLLIRGSSVLAGKSAKREAVRISAVKRAIFQDDDHAAEVKTKIAESGADKILLLGTSEKMVRRIAARLSLPAPAEIIRIEEIASPRAINKALELRRTENRHVIPLPTFAITKDFPGYLIDPLRSFWGKSHRDDRRKVVIDRSIVRPLYSSFGSFYIAEAVIVQLAQHLAAKTPGIARVGRTEVNASPEGITSLLVEVNVFYGEHIPRVLQKVQSSLKETIEYLTGLTIGKIQVTARRVELPS
jgi:adenylate kinase family enzyme